MTSLMEDFAHLKIQLKDIASATNNFAHDKLIGRGGFGLVYTGELSLPNGQTTKAAFKRLDRQFGQGNTEFWKEIMLLSKCKHENLVSLMHFCVEGDEMILVYEYVSRGSLDKYLSDVRLTWNQRLKICIGAAHGLQYLHDPKGTRQRILHLDIKSSNILLDEKWTAKVSDFGLSKIGPANQAQTYVISNVVGTHGYCDPLYWETGILTKESDVYSFGVMLLEVICGRLCIEYNRSPPSEILVRGWRRCYLEQNFDEIIFHDIKEQMEWGSFCSFSAIAYQCLETEREKRPTMEELVKALELALERQEVFEDSKKKMEKIASLAVPPLVYTSPSQFFMLLSKGIFVDDGKTWLSLDKNHQICKMTSAKKCISKGHFVPLFEDKSRFSEVCEGYKDEAFKLQVSTQFLLAHVTYAINFIFKFDVEDNGTRLPFKYKVDETPYLDSGVPEKRDDGWLITELHQFTSTQEELEFSIQFLLTYNAKKKFKKNKNKKKHPYSSYYFEGIEFLPVNNVS